MRCAVDARARWMRAHATSLMRSFMSKYACVDDFRAAVVAVGSTFVFEGLMVAKVGTRIVWRAS